MNNYNQIHSTTDSPIVIAIGGTGASRETVSEYYSHIVARSAHDIATEAKLFGLNGGGYGHLQTTYDELTDRITVLRDRHPDRKVIAFGHSQGGIHATRLALDGLADAVIAAAAPIKGGVTKNLPSLSGNKEGARFLEHELAADSPFMQILRDDMATDWPQEVPLYIVAATYDIVVPREAQFDVKGVDTRDYVVIPPALALMGNLAVNLTTGVPPNAKHINCGLPVDHFSLPRASGMPRFIDEVVNDIHKSTH